MRRRNHTVLLCMAAAVLLAGCYGRTTRIYEDFPELNANLSTAILEEAKVSSGEQDERLREFLEHSSDVLPYTINAGDFVSIVVYDHPDLTMPRVLVTPDGHIGMLFVGQVKVAGLTLGEAVNAIEEALSQYIINPKVCVLPIEVHSETVTIAGGVASPGTYSVSNGMRLADLFAQAGGSATRLVQGEVVDAADWDRSIIVRNGEVIPVDFLRAIQQGSLLHNILLRRGDYVYVATREESKVYLLGDVANPREMLWKKGLGLLETLATSGWVNETYWHHVIVIRGGLTNPRMYKVDLDGILQGKKPNVALESGDIVYVPHDDISEYNVFVRKLLPTGQLFDLFMRPRGAGRGW